MYWIYTTQLSGQRRCICLYTRHRGAVYAYILCLCCVCLYILRCVCLYILRCVCLYIMRHTAIYRPEEVASIMLGDLCIKRMTVIVAMQYDCDTRHALGYGPVWVGQGGSVGASVGASLDTGHTHTHTHVCRYETRTGICRDAREAT